MTATGIVETLAVTDARFECSVLQEGKVYRGMHASLEGSAAETATALAQFQLCRDALEQECTVAVTYEASGGRITKVVLGEPLSAMEAALKSGTLKIVRDPSGSVIDVTKLGKSTNRNSKKNSKKTGSKSSRRRTPTVRKTTRKRSKRS